MTTKELINQIAQETGMRKPDISRMLDSTIDIIREQLLDGKSVHIQNFGVIETKKRNQREYVHPKTGEKSVVGEKIQVSFKQNTVLKELINTK